MKNIRNMTPEEIRTAGLQALERELGVVGAARFLQQFEKGTGDYTEERHSWLGEESIEEIEAFSRQINERRSSQS